MELSSIQSAASPATPWGRVQEDRSRAEESGATSESSGAPSAPADEARFSPEALALSRAGGGESEDDGGRVVRGEDSGKTPEEEELTAEERQQVEKLKSRDAEVRAHEAAHLAAGGSHVRGGATFSYQQGPDGRQYAVGGEVGIDVSSVAGNPQATIQKMQQVRAAALAPAEPSGADRGVAARAAQVEAEARQQLAERTSGRVAGAYSERETPAPGGLVDTTA